MAGQLPDWTCPSCGNLVFGSKPACRCGRTNPVRLPAAPPVRLPGGISGRVVHVDRYGNLVTDIPAAWLPDGPCRAEVDGHAASRRVTHYAEIPPGEAAMLAGSLGTVELSLNGAGLARAWEAGRGARVDITWNGS